MIAETSVDEAPGPARAPAGAQPRYATFGLRAVAWGVDAIPYAFVPFIVGRLAGTIAAIAAFFVVGIVWSILPEARTGVTLGKLLSGIRVEAADGNGRIGLSRSALRWVVKYLVCGVLPVGYLWYFRDRRCRAWQDLAAGSVVVDLARGPVSASRPG